MTSKELLVRFFSSNIIVKLYKMANTLSLVGFLVILALFGLGNVNKLSAHEKGILLYTSFFLSSFEKMYSFNMFNFNFFVASSLVATRPMDEGTCGSTLEDVKCEIPGPSQSCTETCISRFPQYPATKGVCQEIYKLPIIGNMLYCLCSYPC